MSEGSTTRIPRPVADPLLPGLPAVGNAPVEPIPAVAKMPAPGPVAGHSLGIPVVMLLCVLVVVNVCIHIFAQRSQHYRLLAAIPRVPFRTPVLLLGNSLMEAGVDLDTFDSAWSGRRPGMPGMRAAFSLALGATSPVEHFLILSRALKRPIQPQFIVYGFFDDQLFSPVAGEWSDLEGNRALSYTFPAQAAELYAPGSWMKKGELMIIGSVPMLAERSMVWSRVELLRRRMEDMGMPPKTENRFGRVSDFSALEAGDEQAFNVRCETALAQAEFSRPVEKIVRLCQSQGARLVLVEMPMPKRHRELFYGAESWHRLQGRTGELAERQGLRYVRASDWVTQAAGFEDATHLSPEGAKLFSRLLADELRKISTQ